MERRNFIKGMLVSAVAGEAVVKLATAEEVRELVPKREVILGHTSPDYFFPGNANFFGGEVYAKSADGSYMPIGYLTSVTVQTMVEEAVNWEGQITLVPGMKCANASFKGSR